MVWVKRTELDEGIEFERTIEVPDSAEMVAIPTTYLLELLIGSGYQQVESSWSG